MPRTRQRSVLTGVAAVVAAGLVAAGIALTTQRSGDDPVLGGGEPAVTTTVTAAGPDTTSGPDATSGTGGGGTGSGTGQGSPDGTVTITREGPDLPGGSVLARCDTDSRRVVARYDTAALGEVVLQCGDSGQGYEHIRVRHTEDWQDVVTGHGSRDWDDAMLTAVGTVLGSPRSGYPVDAGDGKVCYAAPVRFDDGSRPDADPFVKVIVSATTDRVITAYPTRTDGC
ncbi:hypothetical protein [Curtobacterium sp. MCBA15_012]|uniref:hypothetical protein n=1 Tax=Curtobacterium sp. MCBA15_012 TaxID=1898738 RepID=UPI0008DCFFCD|nr:hypothetical protein [Curtobacterium sp. MCBA15_012]WIB00556.1 hypothetical protein QOL15_02360 [Curtobacterium sp. MCBA15_012]